MKYVAMVDACQAPMEIDATGCAQLQTKHQGNGSGSDIMNLGVWL